MTKENFGRNLSEQNVVSKAKTPLMKKLEKNLGSLQNEKRRLEKVNGMLIRRYGEQKTLVGRSFGKPVRSAATHSLRMAMCTIMAILKRSLKEISEMDHFRQTQRQSRTGSSKRNIWEP